MGNSSSAPEFPAPPAKDDEKKCASSQKVGIKSGKKICCCCPETKKARDACILSNGEDNDECKKLIELHKECLRGEGFDVK
jgi:cytochrome c oxidase assembly protein subunit 17